MDTNIVRKDHPEVPAPTEEKPHVCYEGWVFLGFEDEDGEEHHEAVPCRRCRPETR